MMLTWHVVGYWGGGGGGGLLGGTAPPPPPPKKKKHPKNITPITPVQKKVYPSPGIFYPLLCLILKPFNCHSTGAKNMKKPIYYKSLLVNKTINTKKQMKPKENKPYY